MAPTENLELQGQRVLVGADVQPAQDHVDVLFAVCRVDLQMVTCLEVWRLIILFTKLHVEILWPAIGDVYCIGGTC